MDEQQQQAVEALRDAIQQCEEAGMSVWCNDKMITGAMPSDDASVVDLV